MIGSVNSGEVSAAMAKENTLVAKMKRSAHGDDSSFESVLHAKKGRPIDKKLMDSCTEMESILVGKMLKEMRNTLHKEDSLLYGGMAENIFEDMLYDEYAMSMSKNSNFGLAKMLYEQLS